MPHRPLFVLRCHHFSPVIYFIAISVSLLAVAAVAAMPFLLLHLRLPPSLPPSLPATLPLWPLILSFSRTLSSTPLRTVPTNTSLETLHYTTQHNSALLTLLETLLYVSVSVSFSLLPFLSRAARAAAPFSLSLALPRTGGISTTMPSARKKDEDTEERRGRYTEIERDGRERLRVTGNA